jgi:hypothetical protein
MGNLKKEMNKKNELLDELKKTRSDMNAGMFGKKNTETSGKIGAGCLILIIVVVLILLVAILA